MSDNFDEHARTFNRHGGIRGLADEIDALRAENERHNAEFREQITAEHVAYQELHRENERLRAALETAAAMVRKADPDLADALERLVIAKRA